MIDNTSNSLQEIENSIDIKLIIIKYARLWYWFLISVLIALGLAFAYLKITTPLYDIKAVILIKDEKKGVGNASDALKDLDILQGSNKIVENEIEVLKSRNLITKVIDELKLTISYFEVGAIRDEEIFGTSPFWINPEKLAAQAYEEGLRIKVLNKQKYELQSGSGKHIGTYAFSQQVICKYGRFRVFTNDANFKVNEDAIKVEFHSKEDLIDYYEKNLKVELLNKQSTVLELSLKAAVPAKGKMIMQKILEAYTFLNIEDKNREATSTLRFIEDRLRFITNELVDVEEDVEKYKSSQGFTDLSAESNLFLEKVKENDSKLNEVDIQLQVLGGVDSYLKSNQKGFAPATLMVNDPVLTGLISKLSELELEREKYAQTTQAANPLLGTINTQIANTKQAIRENVSNQRKSLMIAQSGLRSYNNRFESAIRTIPHKEREFVSIKRQQGIKESLYLLLLQKREETALTYASTVTDSRVVDPPYSTSMPVKPKKLFTYLIALFIGSLLPIGVLYGKEVLNDKVQSRKEIEQKTGLPIFAEIARKPTDMKEGNIIDLNNKSFIAEQFRVLRTNLQYTASNSQDNCKTIMITSSIGGEGKSFISVNLAASIALLDKKVIILELDLRKPKLSSYLNMSREKGLSTFLVSQASEIDITKTTEISNNLHFISSGPIPPNPSELLQNGRLENLLAYLKTRYDYILIDSPPVSLVSDALILQQYVDVCFYLVRHEYTPKSYLGFINELKTSQKFKSLSIIFNGLNYENVNEYKYGYVYGYYG